MHDPAAHLDLVHVGNGRDGKELLKVGRTGHSGGTPHALLMSKVEGWGKEQCEVNEAKRAAARRSS